MIRKALLASSLALFATSSAPSLGDVIEPESEPTAARSQQTTAAHVEQSAEPGASEKPEGRQEWRKVLLAANQEVAIALRRSMDAHKAYRDMRQRRRPRGDAKQAIMDELELSSEHLTTAKRDLEELEETARREGAPSRWLKFDPAEIEASTQFPAARQP